MYIPCSESNRSAFYLYSATSVGLSATLPYAHAHAPVMHKGGESPYLVLQKP